MYGGRGSSQMRLKLNFSATKECAMSGANPTYFEEWAKIPVARCDKLIETYPKQLAAIISSKGGSKKYWGE